MCSVAQPWETVPSACALLWALYSRHAVGDLLHAATYYAGYAYVQVVVTFVCVSGCRHLHLSVCVLLVVVVAVCMCSCVCLRMCVHVH